MPTVNIIAAMSENRVIGRGGHLPWRLPDEMKHFMRLTTGHTVVMGRRTFESIDSKALANRRNIILTRRPDYAPAGVEIAAGVKDVIGMTRPGEEVFICGGEQVYREALPIGDRLYLTVVHAEFEGDTYFPAFDPADWTLIDAVRHEPDERHAYAFTFNCYERQR
jgi:dihydrofolate reductase